MTNLTPVSILAGLPQSSSVDTTRLTNDDLITDWYTYFLAAEATITQSQTLSATAILSGIPIVSTTGLIQNTSLQANDIQTQQPFVSNTTLLEDSGLQASNIVTASPDVSSISISQVNVFSANPIVAGIPAMGQPALPVQQTVSQAKFGGWPKRVYEHTELAIARNHSLGYRSMYKFGYNPDVDNAEETVWSHGGNYPWLSNSSNMYVSSTSVDDSSSGTGSKTIIIEGLDENYKEIQETLALNGQTQVVTQNAYLRVHRAFVGLAGSSGTSQGTIYVGSSGSTGGVPDGEVYADLGLGNQTQLAAYTVPAGYSLYVDDLNFTAGLSQANKVATCSFVSRDFGTNVFRTRFINVIQSNELVAKFKYPQYFAERTDLECRVSTNTSNNAIGASFQGVLVLNNS